MRWLLIILALLPTMLWGQTSPALNTLTGPYRGLISWVTPKTLKDSIDVLEARLLAVISDSTGLAFDSVYALSAALTDVRNRYLADSTAKANLINTLDSRVDADSARLDSLRLASARQDDTTLYKRILGWPSDSALYSTFSGWRMLDNRAAKADSATGDSLWSNINQLKTSGGRILILGADTVHVYRLTAYDSLPTAGGITTTVSVQGTPSTVIQLKDSNASPFSFTINRPAGSGTAFLEFRDLRMITANNTGMMYVYRGRLRFDNCDIDGGLPYILTSEGNAGDSLIIFKGCRFGNVYSYISGRVGFISIEDCEGNVLSSNWSPSGITQNASRYGVHIINPRNLGFSTSTSSAGSFDLWITGGSICQTGNYRLFEYCNTHASGVQFYFNPNASAANATVGINYSYNGMASFEGCSFWNGGVAGASIRVTGCYFYNSPTAMAFYSGGSLNSCTVQSATTAVSANVNTKIHGLLHSGCSTLISGTPAALADTMTVY